LADLVNGTRRCFLKVVASGAALGAGLGCSSDPASPEVFGDVSAGNITDLPIGTLKAIDKAPAYIGRDDAGLYAMTATCTHDGCDMISDGSIGADVKSVNCACHGSHFDANGHVTSGPAKGDLAHFSVEVDASGNVTVHGGIQVGAAIRVAVT